MELRGFSFMGGRSLRLRDVPIVRGSPRIVIRGFAVMGGIDVVSRSSQSGRRVARAVSEGMRSMADEIDARSGPGANPIDLAALGRDIRREIREQHRSARHGSRPCPARPADLPGSPVAASPEPEPPAPAASRAPEPAPAPFATDGTVTILFCDMVDYAGMTERLGDQASRQVLHDHHRIVRDALARPRRPRNQRAGRRLHARLRWRGPGPALRGRHPAAPSAPTSRPRRWRDHRRAHRRAHRRRGGRG